MKIEFENSIRRLSFLCRLTDIKIAWINPWDGSVLEEKCWRSLFLLTWIVVLNSLREVSFS